jgi:hypothetical protein
VSRPIALAGRASSIRGSLAVRVGQRLEPEFEPGRQRAADVRSVGCDDVEVGRRAEVDDDRRRAVQALRGEGIDQPIGAHLSRPIDAHGDAARCRRGECQPDLEPPASSASVALTAGTTLAATISCTSARRLPSSASRPSISSRNSSTVARASVAARRVAPTSALEPADGRVGVADIDSDQHLAPMIRGRDCESAAQGGRACATIGADLQRP